MRNIFQKIKYLKPKIRFHLKFFFIAFYYAFRHPRRFWNALTARGKTWAMRGLIFFLIILIAVPTTFWYQAKHAKAGWFDENWMYRESIPVTNNTTQQTNVYISVTVDTSNTSKFKNTCGDIRFTDLHGNLKPYLIASGCGTSSTVIYVALDTFPAGAQTLYMYYGNPSAPDGFTALAGSGSVTQANMRLSIVNGTSFADFSTANTLTQFSGNKLAISDSAGKKLTGYIKAAGTGETYGSELLSNTALNDTTNVSTLNATVASVGGGQSGNCLQVTTTANYGGGYEHITSMAAGGCYLSSAYAKKGTSAFKVFLQQGPTPSTTYWDSGWISNANWINYSGYSTVKDTISNIWFKGNTTGSTALFDTASLKQVLTPSATGATITSTSGGSTFNWVSEDSGFNRNDSSNYTYSVFPLNFSTEASSYSVGSLGAEEVGPGPVAYWKFDEGQGTMTYDATANHNDGTLHGNAAWKPESDCLSGKCLQFDGDYDSVSAGHDSSIEMGTSDMTISAWVRINSSQTGYAGIVTKGAGKDTDEGYELSYDTTIGGLFFWVSNGTIRSTSYSSWGLGLNDDKWHHIELVAKRNDREHYYVDGKDVGYQPGTNNLSDFNGQNITNSGDDLYIGEWVGGNSFKGYIDEVKLYKYVRTTDQIKQDYNAGLAGQAANQGAAAAVGQSPKWMTDGLVGHWAMDESSGTTVADSSGNGNNGTLTNAQETGTSDGSGNTTTTMKDTDGSLYTTDAAYNNMILHFNGACGSITDGTERTIQYYTGASKTFTVATLPSSPNSCSYEVRHQTAGKFGNGLAFDGSNDYAEKSYNSALNPSKFTISLWANRRAAGTGHWNSAFTSRKNTGGLGGYMIYGGDDGKWQFWTADGSWGWNRVEGNDIVNDKWIYLTGVYDGSTMTFYNDGVRVGSYTGPMNVNDTMPLRIGAGATEGSPDFFFNGLLDDVRVYNRALSPDEVGQLSQWAPGPVGEWKMDDHVKGDGQTIVDSSGNGYNLGTSWGDNSSGMDCTVPGKYGGGCQLDGVDDAMGTYDDHFKLRDAMTIEAWVKPPSNPVLDGGIITQGSSYEMRVHQGTDTQFQTFIYIGGSVYDPNGYPTLDKNTWQHIALTYDKYTRQLIAYKNGVITGERTLSGLDHYEMDASTDPFLLGEYSANYNGSMDDVRVYNYARTSSQVTEDMVGDLSSSSGGNGAVGSPMFELKYDEGTGTVAHDSGANKDDGNLVDGATWDNSGKFGRAVKLDGLNDRVQTSTSAPYEYQGGDMTISTWFKPDASDSDTGRIISKPWNSNGDYNYMLWLEANNKIGVSLQTNLGTVTFDSNASISDGVWHYLALSLNGTTKTASLYIDSNLDTTYSTSGITWSSMGGNENIPLTIGSLFPYDPGWSGATSWSVKGSVDETKVYQAALSSDQIKQDMNGGSEMQLGGQTSATGATGQAAEYCVPGSTDTCTGPFAEWKFDEKTGDTVHDTSGNGYDGTIGGANQKWGRGQFGSAVDFNDGEDDNAMAVADGNQWDLAGKNTTVQFWMKARTTQSGTYPNLIDHYDGANGWSAGIDSSNGSLSFIHGDGTATPSLILVDANDFRDNKWHFVSVTLNNSTQDGRMYVDGKFAGEDGFSGLTDANGSLLIGGKYSSIFQFDGLIDQTQIYNYVRTPAQIAWDYNRGKPVGWWKFDEGQGMSAYDSSGNGNTGTLEASMTPADWVDGKFNKALDFDGSNDYVGVPYNPWMDKITGGISVSAWVKPNVNNSNQWFVDRDDYGSNRLWTLTYTNTNKVYFRVWTSAGNAQAENNVSLDTGVWQHFVGTWDGSAVRLYKNGVLVAGPFDLGGSLLTSTNVGLDIGQSADNSNNFDGQIDDVRVYNYALTQEQVKQVMNNGAQIRFGDQ